MSFDFIEQYLYYTSATPSPEIYRLWCGISTLAGVMERRLFTMGSGGEIFPNLYVMLVGGPASGKSIAIERARELLRETKWSYLSPIGVTKARLLDILATSSRKILKKPNGLTKDMTDVAPLIEYHSLFVGVPEFGTLIPKYDLEFLNVLNHIFDNPRDHRDETRHSKSVDIIHPQLNLLVGTQPGYLSSILPEEAWSTGFMTRILMVYSAKVVRPKDIFAPPPEVSPIRKVLGEYLSEVIKLSGPFGWSTDAADAFRKWMEEGCAPEPEHVRLLYYCGRRFLTVIKLAMISSISRGTSLVVTKPDLDRAMAWLAEAEYFMPDVFRDMVHKSDEHIMQELFQYSWRKFVKDKASIHEAALLNFLRSRVPSERVDRILGIAERSGMFYREVGTKLYRPRPPSEHGTN